MLIPREMLGLAIPVFLVSWIIGLFVAIARRGDPESATSERLVLVLAILPPADFFLRVSIAIAYFGPN
jgi:hypothetical protein